MKFDRELYEIIAEEYVRLLKEEVKRTGKIDSGSLLDSISYEIIDEQIVIKSNYYMRFVDQGRKSNSTPPPIDAILRWGAISKITDKKERLNRAFATQKSIAKKGIKPTYIISNVQQHLQLDEVEDYLYKNLNTGVFQLINKMNIK